jgi:hypothetical protein
MKPTDWPPEEVAKIAAGSGKPLEVTCALAFKKAEWLARLGSYFIDPVTRSMRELDVLIEKTFHRSNDGHQLRIRVLLSCKGFRPTCAPLAYSVSRDVVRPYENRLPSRVAEVNASAFEREAATQLLKETGLIAPARPIVAYDVVEREEPRKEGQPATFKPLGDKTLYAGIDSAVKAALFWKNYDGFVTGSASLLYVPVLVIGTPFWDVCIDHGQVGAPEILKRGYQTCAYPIEAERMTAMTTLVWAAEELDELVEALGELSEWFCENAR